jgi:hypothetical protein
MIAVDGFVKLTVGSAWQITGQLCPAECKAGCGEDAAFRYRRSASRQRRRDCFGAGNTYRLRVSWVSMTLAAAIV